MKSLNKFLTVGLLFGFASSGLFASSVMAQSVAAQNQQQKNDEQVRDSENAKDTIETMVTTATRTEKPLSEVVSTVSVIDAVQIEKQLANNISDLVRYEPGVSVSGEGRFGYNGFTIRGIDGDRILTLIDNTPIADEFSFGPFLSARRDLIDIDAIKSVEIVRGSASSSFGSNAIGGVVNFITKEPYDLLEDELFSIGAKLGYSSTDKGKHYRLHTAFGDEVLSAMVSLTRRDYEERRTYFDESEEVVGASRRAQNPQDADNTSVFLKAVYNYNDSNKFSVVYDRFEGDAVTNVLSSLGVDSRGTVLARRIGTDTRTRDRFSLNYDFKTDFAVFDSGKVIAYTQRGETQQNTQDLRISRGIPVDRFRGSSFEQENTGINIQFSKGFTTGIVEHQLLYGLDYDKADSVTQREGNTTDSATGRPLREFFIFPTRDFPNSEYTTLGVFLQNEMSFFDGKWELTPSVRYDSFELETNIDSIYSTGNSNAPAPIGYDESAVSVKIGSFFHITDQWSIFSQYAEGFRAPPLDAVNTAFTNLAGGYTTLPNPNLQPESSDGIEFGLRFENDSAKVRLAFYRNNYDDFIEPLATLGFNPRTRLLEFQAINLDEAEIEGVELKASYAFPLEGLVAHFAYAYAKGEQKNTSEPINSIDPQQWVLGLAYDANNKWGAEASLTLTDGKDLNDINVGQGRARIANPFKVSSHQILDLFAYYRFSDKVKFNVGVFNVFDEQYHSWSNALVQDASSPALDRLTSPGINFSANLKVEL